MKLERLIAMIYKLLNHEVLSAAKLEARWLWSILLGFGSGALRFYENDER
ncbi:hypothetical protein [Saccharibacillus alkalitolerans]|uniref:Uncharacterized protein n=1 Tax=Saccharibacillus alkalitolerans TaxID=2705290 RepID=A0ABX0FBN7_9BACL|nr:hypothetical protein [Saccharibacillus alkalitolerans]NGZ77785.1 hypothetical protein [Saccharibacillus alkalitolerans]